MTSDCTLTPWPCQRRQGRGPALGPKRRWGNKDATPPGPTRSGTASENSDPEAAGEGGQAGQPLWGTAVGGRGGGGHHTQTLDPANPPDRAQLPANQSTTASLLCSGQDGPGPGPAPQSECGCEALPSGMSREGQSGERGGKPGRSTGGRTEPGRPASHPLKESTAPRRGVGAERKTGAAAELPCLWQREACLLGSGTALGPHRRTHCSVPEAIFCSRRVYQAQSLSRGAEMAEYQRLDLQGAPELQDKPQGHREDASTRVKMGKRGGTRTATDAHAHLRQDTRARGRS